MHDAIPDVASVPLAEIVTGRLYQPFESGGRCEANDEIVGGVASRLIAPEILLETFVVPPSGVTVTVHE